MRNILQIALIAVFIAALGSVSVEARSKMTYANVSVSAPTKDRVTVCHGFGCRYQSPAWLSARDLRSVRRIMAKGERSAKAERAAIAKAVQWFDRRYAKEIGTHVDIGGFDPQNARKRGQQDCIDEAITTTGVLKMLSANGLLTHHRVGRPTSRGFFLDGRYPHATATVFPLAGGHGYAVDPWLHNQGAKPDIIALPEWRKMRRSDYRAFTSR